MNLNFPTLSTAWPWIEMGLTLALVVAAASSAWAAHKAVGTSKRLEALEVQRDSVELQILGVQRVDEEGRKWGLMIANLGHRDTGIYSAQVRLLYGDGFTFTHGGIPLESQSSTDFRARTVPAGGAVWAEIGLRTAANLSADGVVGVRLVAKPVVGSPVQREVTDPDRLAVLQAGNAITFRDSS